MMTKSSLFLHTQLAPRQEKQLTDIINSLMETKTLIFDHRMGYIDILHAVLVQETGKFILTDMEH